MMDSLRLLLLFSLFAGSIYAADFQNGQAARAVIGQSSFSAQDTGVSATTLVISNGRLYAADATHRLLTFDLANIPGVKDDLAERQGPACVLCGFSPSSIANQPVLQGIAAVSVFGKTVIVADASNHRVLIWSDVSSPSANQAPDVVLGGAAADSSPVSAASIIEPVSVAFDGKRLFVGDAALHRVLVWNSLPSTPHQPADSVLGQPNFVSTTAADTPAAGTLRNPAALASDGINLFVADPLDRRILVFTPGDSPLPANAVLNSASLSPGPLAPGTLVTISGAGLSDSSDAAPDDGSAPLPKRLAGAEVLFDGVLLPLLSVSPTQIRAQLPYDIADASAASLYVRTAHANGLVTITNAIGLELAAANPGLFAFGGAEPRAAMVLHANPNSPNQPATPVTADDPARPGEILTLWAAGLGPIEDSGTGPIAGVPFDAPDAPVAAPVTVFVNGRSAQILFANLPEGAIGVYEIRVILPSDLASDAKTQLVVVQDGFASNTVTFPVQTPIQ